MKSNPWKLAALLSAAIAVVACVGWFVSASSHEPAPVPRHRSGSLSQAAESVYVTRTGTKFHRAGCSYIRRGATECTKTVAVAKGLGPCSRCKP